MFGGIIKLFYVFLVGWLLYRLYKAIRGPARVTSRTRPETQRGGTLDAGELVQDPQCGVYIPKETAVKGPDGNLFCSEACRDEYQKKSG